MAKIIVVYSNNDFKKMLRSRNILIIATVCLSCIMAQDGWSPPEIISNTIYGATYPSAAVDQLGRIHCVWQDAITPLSLDEFHIFYRILEEGEWSEIEILTDTLSEYNYPNIFIDSQNNPHVVWWDFNGPNSLDIYYRYFDGDEWSTIMNVSESNTNISATPSVVVDTEGTVYIAWHQLIGVNGHAFLRSWHPDSGWSEIMEFAHPDPNVTSNNYPKIRIDSNDDLHMVWSIIKQLEGRDYLTSIVYQKRYQGSWLEPQQIMPDSISTDGLADLAIDHLGRLHFALRLDIPNPPTGAVSDIYSISSVDGETFSSPVNATHFDAVVSDTLDIFARYPWITADSSKLYIGFQYKERGFFHHPPEDAFFVWSSDGEWQKPHNLTPEFEQWAGSPRAVVDLDGNIHIFWAAAYDIYHSVHPEFTTLGVVRSESNLPHESFYLFPAFPNPFNPSTTIAYELPEQSDVSLTVYDISGRTVSTLVNETMQPGNYEAMWNGSDVTGKSVSTGVYFARLEAGEFSSVVKMVYLR